MIVKEERYRIECAVHGARADAGAIAVREWLYMRRDELNRTWPEAEGTVLLQLQGEAKQVARLIALIEQGPKIKPTEGNKS